MRARLLRGLSNVSLACGARQNATVIDDELETDPCTDAPAPAGPTQTLHSRRPRAAAANIRPPGAPSARAIPRPQRWEGPVAVAESCARWRPTYSARPRPLRAFAGGVRDLDARAGAGVPKKLNGVLGGSAQTRK